VEDVYITSFLPLYLAYFSVLGIWVYISLPYGKIGLKMGLKTKSYKIIW